MNPLRSLFLLLLCLPAIGGCDSNDDENYEDIVVGNWAPYFIGDENGEMTGSFMANVDEFTFLFRSNRTLTIYLDYNATGEAKGYEDVGLDGSFSIESKPIRWFYWHFDGQHPTLDTNFNFSGRDIFNFSGQADELNALIGGPEMSGVFEIGLERQ